MVLAVLPAPLVLRDSKAFAVRLVNPAQLALPEAVAREAFPDFLAKMSVFFHSFPHLFIIFITQLFDTLRVKLVKMVNLVLLVLRALLALEAYLECPAYPVSKATVVSPVWTDLKANQAQVVKREHKV